MKSNFWAFCITPALVFGLATPSWALIKAGNRWPINLGITGARGDLKPDAPTVIVVVEILPNTPAHGKLEVKDRIVGVNGKRFKTPHKFGYGMDKFGYEGPLMDFGNALEESQGTGRNGKLTLDVMRGGATKTIELTLSTKYGQYAKTYPFNCAKTDKILKELYAYLIKRQRADGSWHGRPHYNAFAALALLSSGEKQYLPAVKRAMKYMAAATNDQIDYRGYDCWKNGLYGVALSEYYLATREEWVLKELDEINRWLVKAQFKDHYRRGAGAGGWGHRPTNRPGGNGYGPICMITAQAMAAWSLIAQCGIEINRDRYELAHEFLVKGTNNIGYVWYADGNGGNDKYADMGRTGGSAVAHAVSPIGGQEFQDYALSSAQCIGTNHNTFFDTHGSAILGMGWTALGAAVDPASFRSLMDHHVWFFNLSHCPDGTFYFMPNRDPNDQDYRAGKHLSASAATALILSIRNKSLKVMGPKGVVASVSAPRRSVDVNEARPRSAPAKGKLKVFILAGQSNMEGKAKLSLLSHQIHAPETKDFFKHLHKDGKWFERDDVWINFLNRRGKLTVGFGSPNRIGPELEFGNTVGDHFDEQVLIIKTAWGGKSLGRDFRPPSSGLPDEAKLNEIVKRTNERNKKRKRPAVTREEIKATCGKYCREMMKEIDVNLGELKTRFPDYDGQGYEIAGFVWFQGWNDMFDPDFLDNYGKHMANFIRDVRKDLKLPSLPFVIGEMGQNGFEPPNARMARIKNAQASMAKVPEFKGNVQVVKTDVFWDKRAAALFKNWRDHVDEWNKVGSDYPYHYLGSALTFSKIGRAFGQAMIDLSRQKRKR